MSASIRPTQKHRVLVASFPKSGTYLIAETLKQLGYYWTGMHLFDAGYTDYSTATLDEARSDPTRLHCNEDLNIAVKRIGPGSFAVGHLGCKESVLNRTDGFKRLFLHRELRTCLVSWMRFYTKTKRLAVEDEAWFSITEPREQFFAFLRARGEFLVEHRFRPMVGWKFYPGTLAIKFEDLIDSEGRASQAIEEIARFLDAPITNGNDIIQRSLSTDTITRSPSLTRLEEYWSSEAEEWFINQNGPEINRRLGHQIDLTAIPGVEALHRRQAS